MLVFTLLACSLSGQSSETDVGEVAGFAGGAFGGFGSHGAVGASFATATSRLLMALLDISYIPLNTETLQLRGGLGSSARRSRLYDFNGGVHVRIPIREQWAPYIAVGGGLLYSTFETVTVDNLGNTIVAGRDNKNFAFHIGGGVRYYLTDNIGLRPELKVYVSDRNFARLSVGIFYQFP